MQLIQEFLAHDAYLLKVVISPDTAMLATTSSDMTIKIWNTSTWQLERTLQHHQKWVWDAVFSADSVLLVTASSDTSSKLWDLRTGEVIRNYVSFYRANLLRDCYSIYFIPFTVRNHLINVIFSWLLNL